MQMNQELEDETSEATCRYAWVLQGDIAIRNTKDPNCVEVRNRNGDITRTFLLADE